MRRLLSTLALVLLLCPFAMAQRVWSVEAVPNTRLQSNYIHISDPDDWITAEVESRINAVLDTIRPQADVFVVVLSSIGDETIERFSFNLFNSWGIGEAERDNGVLILMVEDQHKLRFETGYGVEDELTDALCQKIFTQIIVPYFKEGDYNGGIYAGVCAVAGVFGALPDDSEVSDNQIVALKSTPSDADSSGPFTLRSFFEDFGFWAWAFALFILFVNVCLIVLMVSEMRELNKAADPQHGDGEKVAKLFEKAKTGMVMYPIVSLLCIAPFVLLVYPFFLSFVIRKKKSYRDTPRCCECCGGTMRRLSETEEDAYMTKNQRFEEDSLKVKDYDIWLCDSCGKKMAVPFLLRNAKKYYTCDSCNCLAGKNEYDETVVRPTETSRGIGRHHIVCLQCGHRFTIQYDIPKLSSSSSSSGGSSSGGGSFGGGHSGGGGYTGSW